MEGALAAHVPMTYVVQISGELLTQMLTTGYQVRDVRVVEGLPSGCALIGVRPGDNGVILTFASAYESPLMNLQEHRVQVMLERGGMTHEEERAAMQGEL